MVEGKWVDMLLPKLQHVDVQRLSGGRLHDKEEASGLGDNTTAQAGAEQGDDKAPGMWFVVCLCIYCVPVYGVCAVVIRNR